MVQALSSLLECENFDEELLKEDLSKFKCYKDDKNSLNVQAFLHDSAIAFERQKLARTYLVLDDEKLEDGEIKINGYYTLAIKSIQLSSSLSNNVKQTIAKSKQAEHVAGYLLAQLGREQSTCKGYGKELLNLAVEDIKLAQKQVGGRLVYLDCDNSIKDYYAKQNFKILQNNIDDNSLLQMYIII